MCVAHRRRILLWTRPTFCSKPSAMAFHRALLLACASAWMLAAVHAVIDADEITSLPGPWLAFHLLLARCNFCLELDACIQVGMETFRPGSGVDIFRLQMGSASSTTGSLKAKTIPKTTLLRYGTKAAR